MKQAVTNVCLALSDDEDYVSFDEDDLNAGIQELYDNDSAEDAASDISNEEYFDAAPDQIAFTPTPPQTHAISFGGGSNLNLMFGMHGNEKNKKDEYHPDALSFNESSLIHDDKSTIASPPLHQRRFSTPNRACNRGRGSSSRAAASRRSLSTSKDDLFVPILPAQPQLAPIISSAPKRKPASTDANDLFDSLNAINQPLSLQNKARPSLNALQPQMYRSNLNRHNISQRSASSNLNRSEPLSHHAPHSLHSVSQLSAAAPRAAPVHAMQAPPPLPQLSAAAPAAPPFIPVNGMQAPPVFPPQPQLMNPYLAPMFNESAFQPLAPAQLPIYNNVQAPEFVPLAAAPEFIPPPTHTFSSGMNPAPASRKSKSHHKLSKRIHKLNEMKERKKRKERKIIHKQRINTNVISIELGTLKKSAENIATGDPVRCKNKVCGVILSKHDKLQKEHEDMKLDDEDESIWFCRFCQTMNVIDIDDEEMPTEESVDYIIEPPDDDDNKQKDAVDEEDVKQIVFCIDISGSMCVTQEFHGEKHIDLKGNRLQKENEELSQFIDPMDRNQWMPNQSQSVTYISRLQSVQAAVDAQMMRLKQEDPDTKVGLVTFNNEVTVYGDAMSHHEIIVGDKLNDLAQLKNIGASDKCVIQHAVKDSHSDLSDALWKLEEGGQTALGPALSASIAMASHRRGSQVILCTDGLANVGVGAMDDIDDEANVESTSGFYQDLGNWAMEQGVVVSVISITDDGCNLEALGRIAQVTNGNLRRINPLKLTEKFSGILEAEIIATSTTAKMFLHPGLQFKDTVSELQNLNPLEPVLKKDTEKEKEDEIQAIKVEEKIEKKEKEKVPASQQDIGNVFADTTIFFEYAVHKEVIKNNNYKDLKYLPFQVHISYDKRDGTKMLRVITQQKQVTHNKEKVRENLDYAVLSQYGTRVTTKLCDVGDYEASRAFTNANTRYLHKNARNSSQVRNLASYVNSNIGLDYQMRQQQGQEIRNYNNNNNYNATYSPAMNAMNNNWIARGVQIQSPNNNHLQAAAAPLSPKQQRPKSVHFQAANANQNTPQQTSRRLNRSDKFSSLQFGMKRKY